MRTADRLLRRVVPVMFDRDQLLPETRRRSGHHLRRRFGRGAAHKSGGSGLRAGNAAVPRAGLERHPPLRRPGFLFAVASTAGFSLARMSGSTPWCYMAGRRSLSPLPESETHHQRDDAQKSNRSVSNSDLPSEFCASCGRRMPFAKKAPAATPKKYCSKTCASRRVRPVDRALEGAILELLGKGNPPSSICPSEAARKVRPEDWRDWMEDTRRAARRLAHRQRIEVLQKGRVVDPAAFRGPIRLRRSIGGINLIAR